MNGGRIVFLIISLFCLIFSVSGQDNSGSIDDGDLFFDDFFGESDNSESASDDEFFDSFFGESESAESNESESGSNELDTLFEGDIESLFSAEDLIGEIEELGNIDMNLPETEEEPLLVWGGSYRGLVTAEWGYENVWTGKFHFLQPETESLTPGVITNLFFDGRPKNSPRVFGKLVLETDAGGTGVAIGGIPVGNFAIEETEFVLTDENGSDQTFIFDPDNQNEEEENETEEEPATGTAPAVTISIFELFSDFSWENKLFFRFGKHTIKWGVGYFWSPGDVLNLSAIDVDDPTADREGPISLRTHFPFDVHNAYLYIITNGGAKPSEVAIAPKLEFVLGTTEFGLGAYYQKALSPRFMTTVSTSIFDFDVFFEGVLSIGSDKIFYKRSVDQSEAERNPDDAYTTVLDTYEDTQGIYGQATTGFLYAYNKDDIKFSIIGQYLFNMEGYQDNSLLKAAYYHFQNQNGDGVVIAEDPADTNTTTSVDGNRTQPQLRAGDLQNTGVHYAAVTFNWQEILKSDFSASIFILANLSDLSGYINPGISYSFFDEFSVSFSGRLSFGEEGDELTNFAAFIGQDADDYAEKWKGPTFSFTVQANLGSSRF